MQQLLNRGMTVAVCFCLLAVSAASPAAELSAVSNVSLPAIELSEGQAQAAGIVVAQARPAQVDLGSAEPASGGIRLAGRVVTPADNTGVILSTVSGQLESVLVQIGAKVQAGQAIARVHSPELAAMQREFLHAQAEAAVARARLDRDETLFEEGIIAAGRLSETRATYQMALATRQEQRRLLELAGYSSAAIDSLRANALSSTVTLQAHTNAVVLSQGVATGQPVERGTELFRLAPLGHMWLELRASIEQAGGIQVGDIVSVERCGSVGRVVGVGAQLDLVTQTVAVRAELPDGASCVRSNQFIEANVRPGSLPDGLISVPASALVRNANQDFVFVRQGGRFRPVPVVVYRLQGRDAWLRSGVASGEQVAARGTVALKGAWLGLGPQLTVDEAP